MRKKGVVADYLPWIIIGLIVLAVVLISVFLLREKGFSIIDRFKILGRG